jgi:hypothetical protein
VENLTRLYMAAEGESTVNHDGARPTCHREVRTGPWSPLRRRPSSVFLEALTSSREIVRVPGAEGGAAEGIHDLAGAAPS